jgi:hypothetical protein
MLRRSMLRKHFLLTAAAALLCAGQLVAQSSDQPQQPQQPDQPSQPQQPRQPQPTRRGNLQPCWQVAGIDKSVMERHQAIEREARSQAASVCSNSSLTPQQKHQQIREIRLQARQKMEGMATPAQKQAFFACRQERGMKGEPGEEGIRGGCGEMPNGGAHPNGTPEGAPAGNASPNPPADSAPPQR